MSTRFDDARETLGGPIEPNADELKNGWTVETLTIHVAERYAAVSNAILEKPNPRPTGAVSNMRWLKK